MNINIIGTGSSGNAILFCESVLVDIGLPYKCFKGYTQEIKAVLFTHCHSDHINKTAVRKLYIENEDIKFCCGEFLLNDLLNIGLDRSRIIVIEAGQKYKIDDVAFAPFSVPHDVPNFGYKIMQNGHKHIHATDVFSMDGITAMNYDSATVEANHDLESALKIIEEAVSAGDFSHLSRAIRTHLSVDKAIKFIKGNNIKSWTPVHVGSKTKENVFRKIKESGFNL